MAKLTELLTEKGLKTDLRFVQLLDDSFTEEEIARKTIITFSSPQSIGIVVVDTDSSSHVQIGTLLPLIDCHVEQFSLSSVIYPLGN